MRNWCGFAFVPFRSGCCLGSFASVCQLCPHKSSFPYLVILWLWFCSSSSCHLILRSVCSSSSFEWNHTHKAINLTSPSKLHSTVSSAAFMQTFQFIISSYQSLHFCYKCLQIHMVAVLHQCCSVWSRTAASCRPIASSNVTWWSPADEGTKQYSCAWPQISLQKRHPQPTSGHSSVGSKEHFHGPWMCHIISFL